MLEEDPPINSLIHQDLLREFTEEEETLLTPNQKVKKGKYDEDVRGT